MPRGRPRGDQERDPKTNKMEAVRRAMDGLGFEAPPTEIQKFVMDNFGQDMSANMVSSYKSSIRRESGLTGKRKSRGRPRKDDATEAVAPVSRASHDAVPWKDIRTIKDIADRIGKKGLRELVELLD